MANGTYYYVVTAVNAAGETQRSVQSPAVTLSGSNNAVQLAWTPISGAIQYKLYRTTTSGSYSSPALIATPARQASGAAMSTVASKGSAAGFTGACPRRPRVGRRRARRAA